MFGPTRSFSCGTNSVVRPLSRECRPTTSVPKGSSGVTPSTIGTPTDAPATNGGWERLRALLSHVEVVRLDHFRAFAAAWHVPAEATTARQGDWVPGPGAEFFSKVAEAFGG